MVPTHGTPRIENRRRVQRLVAATLVASIAFLSPAPIVKRRAAFAATDGGGNGGGQKPIKLNLGSSGGRAAGAVSCPQEGGLGTVASLVLAADFGHVGRTAPRRLEQPRYVVTRRERA